MNVHYSDKMIHLIFIMEMTVPRKTVLLLKKPSGLFQHKDNLSRCRDSHHRDGGMWDNSYSSLDAMPVFGTSGPWFNIKMSSYQYRKSHCGDKTIIRSSYLPNGISYTGKTTSLYWIRAQNSGWLVSQGKLLFGINGAWGLRHWH